MNNVLPPSVSYQRQLEWWCVLNAKKRPSDLPPDLDETTAFLWVQKHTIKSDRMAFWNGDFKCGQNVREYINP